ncbi:hypothetical protein ABK040_008730 [Willaertia magna]
MYSPKYPEMEQGDRLIERKVKNQTSINNTKKKDEFREGRNTIPQIIDGRNTGITDGSEKNSFEHFEEDEIPLAGSFYDNKYPESNIEEENILDTSIESNENSSINEEENLSFIKRFRILRSNSPEAEKLHHDIIFQMYTNGLDIETTKLRREEIRQKFLERKEQRINLERKIGINSLDLKERKKYVDLKERELLASTITSEQPLFMTKRNTHHPEYDEAFLTYQLSHANDLIAKRLHRERELQKLHSKKQQREIIEDYLGHPFVINKKLNEEKENNQKLIKYIKDKGIVAEDKEIVESKREIEIFEKKMKLLNIN